MKEAFLQLEVRTDLPAKLSYLRLHKLDVSRGVMDAQELGDGFRGL